MTGKNIGLIGLGQQGKQHLHNLLRFKDVNVAAAADLSTSALKYAKNLGVKNLYKDYNRLLSLETVDAVIISLPNFLHLESTMRAAEEGKDVFLEKPLARDVEEGRKIKSTVEKTGVRLMVGYPMRFSESYTRLKEWVDEGIFGEVELVDASNISTGPFSPMRDQAGPVPVPPWWFDRGLTGGGALLDLGSHLVNLLTWYFGEAEYAESHLGYIFNLEVEDLAVGFIKFKDGPFAVVKAGWFSHDHHVSLAVSGTSLSKIIYNRKSRVQTVRNALKAKLGDLTHDPKHNELKYFLECLDSDTEPEPSVDDGLRDLEIITSMYNNQKNPRLEPGRGGSP